METTIPRSVYSFLAGGGEMGALTRALDWSNTKLGHPDGWPQSLRTMVGVVLSSRVPMLLWWGNDLIQFYNDAYRTGLSRAGKHPMALGKPGQTCWAETWPLIKPFIDQVLTQGEATWSDSLVTPLYPQGSLKSHYWAFNYSPVLDETGQVTGVLVVCQEASPLRDNWTENEQMNMALQAANMGIWSVYPLENRIQWDERCQKIYRWPAATLPLDEFVSRIHPEDLPTIRATLSNPPRRGADESALVEYRITSPVDGELRWMRLNGKAYFNEQGTVYYFTGTARDITRERQQNEARKTIEKRFQIAFDNAAVGVVLLSTDGLIQTSNQAFSRMIGYTPEELQDVCYETISHTDDLPLNQQLVRQVVRGERPSFVLDKRYVRKDGTLLRSRVSSALIAHEEGVPDSLVSIVQDITSEVEAQAEQQKLSRMVETSADFMALINLDGQVDYVNEAGLQLFGLDKTDIRNYRITDLFAPDEYRQIDSHIFPTLIRQGAWAGVLCARHSQTGETIPCFVHSVRINDLLTGQPIAVAATLHDRRAELRAQQVLRQTNEELTASIRQFRFVTDFMPQMVWAAQPDGNNDFYNQQWYDFTGLTAEQSRGKNWIQTLHPDDVPRTTAAWQNSLRTGQRYEIEYRLRRYDGQYRWLLGRALPMRNEQQQIVRWFGTCTDIHDQKTFADELEQQVQARTSALKTANFDLRRSNENLERFAYVASHDLQEPLRKIQAFGDLLKETYAAQLGEGQDWLERMQSAAERMSALIRDLLTFSRLTTHRESFKPIPLRSLIDNVLSDLELAINESGAIIEIGDLPTVEGDRLQLNQLFQNLLSNALKFRRTDNSVQPVTPRIWIQGRQLAAADIPATLQLPVTTPYYHQISVTDNGIGFEEKYLDRIFSVFQRLHGRSGPAGTGIGLAIVQKVVENHRGAITARSQLGQGATFLVYLPIP